MPKIFMKTNIILLFTLVFTLNATAQMNAIDSVELKICKTWKMSKRTLNDSPLLNEADSVSNGFTFYKNHSCDNISNGLIEKGKWTYDSKTGYITIILNGDITQPVKLKVIEVTSTLLHVEFSVQKDLYKIELEATTKV